jgi:hypothetical protein
MRRNLIYTLNRVATEKPAAEYSRVRVVGPGQIEIVTKYVDVSSEYAEWSGSGKEFTLLFLSYIGRTLYWRLNWLSHRLTKTLKP